MTKPLLLDYAVPRTGNDSPAFFYDYTVDLNVVTKENRNIPFISLNSSESELLTKTEAERERDEEAIDSLELLTKTFATREQDDDTGNLSLELYTKTKTERERDD